MSFVLRLLMREAQSVIREYILDLIPEKVRKIIGSILLIFGTAVFLWAWFGDWGSGFEGIGGLIALFVGLGSIASGLMFLTHNWDPFE